MAGLRRLSCRGLRPKIPPGASENRRSHSSFQETSASSSLHSAVGNHGETRVRRPEDDEARNRAALSPQVPSWQQQLRSPRPQAGRAGHFCWGLGGASLHPHFQPASQAFSPGDSGPPEFLSPFQQLGWTKPPCAFIRTAWGPPGGHHPPPR